MTPEREVRFAVRLTPRAGVDRVDGLDGRVLRCRVVAPPVEGAANAALIRLLADELAIPPSAIELVSGDRGRRKVVSVASRWHARLVARWPGLAD